ncbi:MAG: DUF192 domain-containing protein [Chlamydiales bacterium]|nr:DUF192 domain-containing protein [Chlamydiales bacterium]
MRFPFWIKVLGKCSLWLSLSCCYAMEPLTLEHARTPDEIAWGLMQRRELPPNHGMLFYFDPPQRTTFWMFNTFIDLSLALIDENLIIREIHELKAYPEMMRKLPPLTTLDQVKRISKSNSTVRFFYQNAARSLFKVSYALEMPAGWFTENGIQVGDSLVDSTEAAIE